eukprot:6205315-Pleurochrysis_carterae.AAC.3
MSSTHSVPASSLGPHEWLRVQLHAGPHARVGGASALGCGRQGEGEHGEPARCAGGGDQRGGGRHARDRRQARARRRHA